MRFTDRSRILEYQKCPRGRYWAYEYGGVGLSRTRLNEALASGIAVHEGLASLLLSSPDVETAVKVALARYQALYQDGANGTKQVFEESAYMEALSLIEALIRAYDARQLPRLLAHYRVLETEREDVMAFGCCQFLAHKHPLQLMARADGLLQERETGDLYILSYKTAARADGRHASEASHDVQGLSETAAVEDRLNGWAELVRDGRAAGEVPDWFVELYEGNGKQAPRIMGIHMEYLLKGDRREDKWNPGNWVQYSPLIRAWRRPDLSPGGSGWEYAWRWEWQEADPATGELRTRRLGKGWEPFIVAECEEVGGTKGWIEMLASGKVQPEAGDCLDAQFVVPPPYFREAREVDDWFDQAVAQETRAAQDSAFIQRADPDRREHLLNICFAQYRRSCDWPTACPFQELCFGSDTMRRDPIASGVYRWRTPHHDAEREQLERAAELAA